MTEENNEIWMLRSARLDQQPTVQKLLKEGFKPFWGTTVTVDKNGEKEKVIRMYFRKAPTIELVAEAIEQQPVSFNMEPLAEFANQFRSVLSGVLDNFVDNFFGKLDEREKITLNIPVVETKLFTPIGDKEVDEVDEPTYDDDGQSAGSGELPGDSFRVVDDVPEEATVTTQRTNAQDSTIESLKGKGNVTILPGFNEDGSIRAMIGADMYTIERDGNFTMEKTGAGTDSTLVGG